MKRDMNKIISQTRHNIPGAYQLSLSECVELIDRGEGNENDRYTAIVEAFSYGFALGMRYQTNKKKALTKK